jgi:hypothetical protein
MATATMKSAAKAQGTVRVLTDGACGAPGVVHILTERPESVVEHRRDEAVGLFPEQGDARSTAVSLIRLPEPVIASMNPAPELCSCPEWHVLRLFGRGRGPVSFETCHEQLADSTTSGVCQGCGYGLRVDSGRH